MILSVVLAVLISLAALWLAFHFREDKTGIGWRKFAGALILGAAIPTMHYTGMAAATFVPSVAPVDLSRAVSVSTAGYRRHCRGYLDYPHPCSADILGRQAIRCAGFGIGSK